MHDAATPRHLQKIWDGTPLEGQRVLVRCYHGLGDTIQFARYLPAVRAIAREVIVWTQPQLMPLIQSVSEGLVVLPLHDGVPDVDYDVDIEIMELASAFNMTLETIPASVPYLRVPGNNPGAPADVRSIGIAWRGGNWDPARSIDFASLRPWFDDTGLDVRWQSLQFDARPTERHVRLNPLEEVDLCGTAALMQAMALVISIDSMPAHLAGALGVPVWTLLPHHADWRWLENRSDSPWYPTMRLFRQSRPGWWDDVLEEVHYALGHPPCFHFQRGVFSDQV